MEVPEKFESSTGFSTSGYAAYDFWLGDTPGGSATGGFAENGCESHLEVLVLSLGLRIITDLNILNSTRFTCSQTPLVGYSYPQTSALNPI